MYGLNSVRKSGHFLAENLKEYFAYFSISITEILNNTKHSMMIGGWRRLKFAKKLTLIILNLTT